MRSDQLIVPATFDRSTKCTTLMSREFLFLIRCPGSPSQRLPAAPEEGHPMTVFLYFSLVVPLSGSGQPPGPVAFVRMHMTRSGESIVSVPSEPEVRCFFLCACPTDIMRDGIRAKVGLNHSRGWAVGLVNKWETVGV